MRLGGLTPRTGIDQTQPHSLNTDFAQECGAVCSNEDMSMKTVLLALLAFALAAAFGYACGFMYVRHGAALTYFLFAAIGGGLITFWSISDEHSHVSRTDRG